MFTGRELIFILVGYLSGSVLYSYLLPKYILHVDVRENSEDRNPGAANAFIHAGPGMGMLVLILELLKGFIPVYLAGKVLDTSRMAFGLILAAPVAGHAYPFWDIRNGGKAIAVSFGVLLGLLPDVKPVFILALLYILFSLVVVIRPHFYRSIVTFVLFLAGVIWQVPEKGIVAGCGIISLIVILRHFARYHGEKWNVSIFGVVRSK